MKNLKLILITLTILGCFALVGIFCFQPSQAQTSTTTISGKFYKLDILATNTQLGIANLFPGASINDNGVVSFTGTSGLFTADGITPVRTIRLGNYIGATQINNNNLLIARQLITNPGPPSQTYQFLSRFDTNQPTSPATVMAGVLAPGFNDFADISASSFGLNNNGQPVFSATALNNTDRQLVTGIRTTFNRQTLSNTALTIQPMIADNGNVVVRAGNTNTSPIRMYSNNLTNPAPVDIATVSPTTFSELGQSPGISDDGEVIVFYGVLNPNPGSGQHPNYNQTYQATSGPGIFASIDVGGGTRRIMRIAGRWIEDVDQTIRDNSGNFDGICDPAELNHTPARCIQGELGFITTGTTNTPINFASFEANARIGVIHKTLPPDGFDNETIIVSFLGTPNSASSAPQYFSNQLGLWTLRVDLKNESGTIREKPFRVTPVIQVDDNLGSPTQKVTGISVYDPIALAAREENGGTREYRRPDHRLAFQVTTVNGTTNGTAIVRATYFDTDEDGLADHWERTGIDFDQDGDIDLALNNPLAGDPTLVGANPARKDVFIEIDYMESTVAPVRTHRPDYHPTNITTLLAVPATQRPMTAVRNAFAAAPVQNVDGTRGITLHNFVDEAVDEVPLLLFPQRGPTNNDDFDDFKSGSNGPSAGTPCGIGANDGHFGFRADRIISGTTPNPNCINILGAKRLVFRYAIFAQTLPTYLTVTPDPNVLGRAEAQGNDLVIAFAVGTPGLNDVDDRDNRLATFWSTSFDYEYSNRQAGTFMHELGHTLGLFHGGQDQDNCKPNYLSIMNYARSSYYGGLSFGDPALANGTRVRLNPAKSLDYSRFPPLAELTEASLIENAGIGGASNEQTIYGITPIPSPLPSPLPFGYTTSRISPANVSLDWNGNGVVDATPVLNMDVNRMIGGGCKNASLGQSLKSYDDWGNLKYNFVNTYNFTDSSARLTDIYGSEQTLEETFDGSLGSPDVDGDGVSNSNDNCVFSPNASQSDSNSNGIGDACDASTTTLADLSIGVISSASSVQINNSFDYLMTVTNKGPSVAQNVAVTDQLPSTVSFVSATASQGSCSGAATVVCNLGTISSSGTASVTIRVTPTNPGKLDNFANVTSVGQGTGDANLFNNTGSTTTTVLDSSQTFTISGKVADINDNGIGGAFVNYSGSGQGSVQTDSNGNYSFTATSGGVYTLKPVKFGFGFSPESRTVAYINSNTIVSFVGGQITTPATKNADFDGDAKTDLSVFRPSEGNWYFIESSTNILQTVQWGLADDKLVPGDYDGDKKTDLAVWRTSENLWYVLYPYNGSYDIAQFGLSTDIPITGDYDGDGKTDIAVWRPSNGTWYIWRSSDGYLNYFQLGSNGDVPMSGDFDGDGRSDFAVFRPSNATWYIYQSALGYKIKVFGLATDKLAPADYDGDGKTDFGVFRPGDGYWYTAPSDEPNPGQNFTSTPFGANGDIPTPGDYDGDGKYDRAMFRPSTGEWWILRSVDTSSYSQLFGAAADKPIPSAYIP
jgi:uncharacterized repeat protein (TIGR01451 family)